MPFGSTAEAGFTQRPAPPGKARCVPAAEREQRHSLVARLDEPAFAEIQSGVVDLVRGRVPSVCAEEHHVCGLELRGRDEVTLWHLAAHLVRGAAAQHSRKTALAGVRRELVDAPDEPRAVEAAHGVDTEQRLGGRLVPPQTYG